MSTSKLPPESGQFGPDQQQNPQWQQQPRSNPPSQGTEYPQFPPQQYQQPPLQPLQQQGSQPPAMTPIRPVRPPNSTGRIALWIIIGIFIGLVIGYPVGHSAANTHTPGAPTSQPVVTSAQLTATNIAFQQTAVATSNSWMTETPAPQIVNHIGDTLSNSVWKVTLNSVKTATSGDQFSQPRAGDIFIVVDVTAQNLSSSPQLLSSGASFTLKDDTGQAYEEKITGIGVPPDALALQPSDKLRGQISYEVPKSVHNFTFQFQDTNGGTATWTFSI